ncbi:hypothetical protein Mame01_53530 [Microbispora amethystogenes]|nr:hypothetical protein Mame01_53530 [Microbispora amethystogenes]
MNATAGPFLMSPSFAACAEVVIRDLMEALPATFYQTRPTSQSVTLRNQGGAMLGKASYVFQASRFWSRLLSAFAARKRHIGQSEPGCCDEDVILPTASPYCATSVPSFEGLLLSRE